MRDIECKYAHTGRAAQRSAASLPVGARDAASLPIGARGAASLPIGASYWFLLVRGAPFDARVAGFNH